jgi:hypothetical protein
MTGFFFSGGLAVWTALFDRRSVSWRAWLAGTLAGALTLVPWLEYAIGYSGPSHRSLWNLVHLSFWKLWGEHALALDLRLSLGPHLNDFLASPRIGGVATHGVAVCAVIIIAGGAAAVVFAAPHLWSRRGRWRELLVGRTSASAFGISAALWAFGGLLTLSGVVIYRHYLLVAFVLPFLWLAGLALLSERAGRWLLTAVCVAQGLLSVLFLAYIHEHHGAPRGDYGVSYDAQPGRQAR